MRSTTLLLVVVALGAGAFASPAVAEPLRANVVSVSPNDIDQAQRPVSIVFLLYEPDLASPDPAWGTPIAGVSDLEVVIHGEGATHRFATEEVGGGRYRTDLVFPEPGGWDLRVSYGAGRYGSGGEVDLGKGGICIAADCVGRVPGEPAPAAGGRSWTIGIGTAAWLATALIAVIAVRIVRAQLSRKRTLMLSRAWMRRIASAKRLATEITRTRSPSGCG